MKNIYSNDLFLKKCPNLLLQELLCNAEAIIKKISKNSDAYKELFLITGEFSGWKIK